MPPNRFGSASRSIARTYTFEEAVKSADAVVHARVGNWLGDNDDDMTTSFAAEAVAVYKGDIPEDFVLIQDGKGVSESKKAAVQGYPLFTYGNELFLFLRKVEPELYSFDYPENSYFICGVHNTVYYVARDLDGNAYATPSFSNYMSVGEFDNQALLFVGTVSIGEVLAQSFAENDPEVWGGTSYVSAAYAVDALGKRVLALDEEEDS